jgi:hypothetical protein
MRQRAASLALLSALAAAALLGCAADKRPEAETNAPPTSHYKDEIIDTLRMLFAKNETNSVSNAMIADPVLRGTGKDAHYTVCVRYTAHGTIYNINADAERVAYFYGGHLNQLIEVTKDECSSVVYKTFPELNQVCAGTGCKR